MHKSLLQILLLVCFHIFIQATYADEIKLINGDSVTGTIQGATSNGIHMRIQDATDRTVPKDSVSYIIFADSDEVITYALQKVQCKILDDTGTHIIIIDQSGVRYLLYSQIFSKNHNSAGKLKLRILPPTGDAFQPSRDKMFYRSHKKFHVALEFGLTAVDAERWRDDFYYYDSAAFPFIGLQLGYNLKEKITLFAEYGISLNTQKANHDYESIFQLHTALIGCEYPMPAYLIPRSQFIPQLKAGLTYIQGDAWTYSFRHFKLNNVILTFIPQIGIRTFIVNKLSVDFHLGYAISPALKLDCPEPCVKEYSLNFSGLTAGIGFLYYFDHLYIGRAK